MSSAYNLANSLTQRLGQLSGLICIQADGSLRVATVREKVLENEMKNFPGQGKVRELHFQSGKLKKMKKGHGKVMEFQNFP